MKKTVLTAIRRTIDACFLVVMAWGFGWLFGIVTGTFLLIDGLSFLDRMATNGKILYWVVLLFPLLIGLIMSIIFTFISIRFRPSKINYILICAILVILPTLPFMKSTISALERSDELGILCFFYVALGIFLGNFIYQRIKAPSNVTSISS